MTPRDPREKAKPTHRLDAVRGLIESGKRVAKKCVLVKAHGLGFSETGIWECVASLTMRAFLKSRADELYPGQWQDAYVTRCNNMELYIKFKICSVGDQERLLLLSFKENDQT